MNKIFLAPRSNETSYKNFLSTIENGVDYSIVEPYLDKDGKNVLKNTGKLFVWGNKETKKSSWEKMQKGDVVLFYKGREQDENEGKFLYAARVLFKQHSKDLGLSLWPPKSGEEPWTCVFFLTDLKPIYIPVSEISTLSGYTMSIVQGFMPLNEVGNLNVIKKYGSLDNFINHHLQSEEVIEDDIDSNANEITAHSEAELLLLKIGLILGYDTYSPDGSSEAYDEKLSEYITLKEIPKRFIGAEVLSLVRQIDVIWFKDNVPKFAFEVEHTTKFGSGFQRIYQLYPLGTKLFIISSSKNYYLFEKFINADPYYKNKSNFRFKDYKQLEKYFSAISEFDKIKHTFLK